MKVTVSFEFGSEAEAVAYLTEGPAIAKKVANRELFAGNAVAASPLPAGPPVPEPIAPQPAPQPVPAPQPGPSPMPPPPPQSGNGSGAVTIQQVMGAMSEYAKLHKAAGVKNVLSHCNLQKVTEANPEQLIWLKGVFDLGQPLPAPGA